MGLKVRIFHYLTWNQGTARTYDNLIDTDLSMYDEILLMSMSVPEFKVKLSYNPITEEKNYVPGEHKDFSCWWHENEPNLHQAYRVEVEVLTDTGIIAKGNLFEWEENRESFYVELTVRSDLDVKLSKQVTWNNRSFELPFAKSNDISAGIINVWWSNWLGNIWFGRATIPYEYEVDNTIFSHLSNVMKQRINTLANGSYFLRISTSFTGSKRDFLKQISLILNGKTVFMPELNMLKIIPFKTYQNDPIIVREGFITSKNYDRQEQMLDEVTLINSVKVYDYAGNEARSFRADILNCINALLKYMVHFKRYSIWGYTAELSREGEIVDPGRIVHTGETIRLNGIDYYIQDIKYDFERLNDLKAFEAECVRFIH